MYIYIFFHPIYSQYSLVRAHFPFWCISSRAREGILGMPGSSRQLSVVSARRAATPHLVGHTRMGLESLRAKDDKSIVRIPRSAQKRNLRPSGAFCDSNAP